MIASLLLLLVYDPANYPMCDEEKADRGIQQEMNICAAEDYRTADIALNAQWRLTMAVMKQRDEGYAEEARRPEMAETLLTAQRAWIKYRDAHCASEGNLAFGGSLAPLLVSTCKTGLTQGRTKELKNLAEGF